MTAGDGSGHTLVVRRLLPAPREKVFAAWLDPSSLQRWMCPMDVAHATVEVDGRVGGRFRIVMHGTRDYDHRGEYLVIDPPSTLSFTWISEGTDQRQTVVTVELFDRAGQTELVLTHRQLPASKAEDHTRGWTDIIRKLDAALQA
jgi:uncharacterized protein YndB with AHSA1/START domain